MLEALSVLCNHCGGALALEGAPSFVTCRFCGTSLRIKRTETAVFTEALEAAARANQRLAEKAEKLERRLERAEAREKLRELDEEWEREKRGFMIEGKDGELSEPTQTMAWTVGAFGLVVPAAVLVAFHDAPDPFVFVILLFPIAGTIGAILIRGKAIRYERALRRYQDRRDELESASR